MLMEHAADPDRLVHEVQDTVGDRILVADDRFRPFMNQDYLA